MTEPLPFCTRCARPSIAVYECADGSTACLGCIGKALEHVDEQEVDISATPGYRVMFDPAKLRAAIDRAIERRDRGQ